MVVLLPCFLTSVLLISPFYPFTHYLHKAIGLICKNDVEVGCNLLGQVPHLPVKKRISLFNLFKNFYINF
jgi:hypothetical protein